MSRHQDSRHPLPTITTKPREALLEAERRVMSDIDVVERQRRLIETLSQGGHDVTSAKKLLIQFESVLGSHLNTLQHELDRWITRAKKI